jgi:hypothetical protein
VGVEEGSEVRGSIWMVDMSDSPSTFFFPLRTNVEYFAGPEGFLSLEGRIKQAVILYERVVFESGSYQATMGPDGAVDTYIPATQLPKQGDRRTFDYQSYKGFSVWAQPHGPGTPPQLLFSSSIERSFRAEFHSLFDRLVT